MLEKNNRFFIFLESNFMLIEVYLVILFYIRLYNTLLNFNFLIKISILIKLESCYNLKIISLFYYFLV